MAQCPECGDEMQERCDGCGRKTCGACGCPACDRVPVARDEDDGV